MIKNVEHNLKILIINKRLNNRDILIILFSIFHYNFYKCLGLLKSPYVLYFNRFVIIFLL